MKKLTNLLILLIVTASTAQNYKFGKVSEEELREQSNAKDPEAHATILYANENVYFQYLPDKGFVVITEVQKRIKIYDKEGVDWATEKVSFYDTGTSEGEELQNLKGYTYYLMDGKVEKDKLDKGSIFKEQTNKYWKQVRFTMPNITDGCVVEFQYSKYSPYISIDDIVLQYDIPVKKLEVDVHIPEYFHFNKYVNPKARYTPKITQSQKHRTETITTKYRPTAADRQVSTSYNKSKLDFSETVYEVDLTDVPALKQEPFIDNMNVYRSVINWEYAMFLGPSGEMKNYSTDWESVTKTIYDHDSFGNQLSKTGYFDDDIDALIANTSDLKERVYLIYDFVKSKVAWNGFYGDYAELGVRKAYKEGSGNVGDVNLMLTAMLRYAGINANPVLISTKSHGIPLFPTRNGFNYVIAAVELPNQLVLLDATDRYAMPNILPKRAINWQGRIVREHGSSAWIDLMHPAGAEESYSVQVKFNSDFSAEGRVRAQLRNTSAMHFRTQYSAMGNDERLQDLEEGKGEIKIEDYKVKNEEILSEPSLQYSYSFILQNAAESIGDKIYISPMLFFAATENEFKQDERIYPLEFTYPRNYSYNISLILPEGYKIEALPESSKVKFNGEEAEFTYMAVEDGSHVVLKVSFDINNTFVLANDYKQFKDFVGMMVNKETEKLILVKDGLAGTE